MTESERLSPATLEATRLAALVREQCAAEVAETTAQGRERAERIAATAGAEADALRAAAHKEGVERGQRQAARLLAAAEAKSRREWLLERETLIEEAITRARSQLQRFTQMPGAREILIELIREGLRVLPSEPVRVSVPEGCQQLLDEAAAASLAADGRKIHVETDPVLAGGVILETLDGRRRFDNSFDARIRRAAKRLRRLAADTLFGEEG
jgi:vacuolar-type H+-ATPase subunit E/Vma4